MVPTSVQSLKREQSDFVQQCDSFAREDGNKRSGMINSTGDAVAANYVEGSISGNAIGGSRFFNGGTSVSAFFNAAGNDFWRKGG